MSRLARAPYLLLAAAVVSCGDGTALISPGDLTPTAAAAAAGVQQVAPAYDPHFAFLPPMVPSATYGGTFDPALSPVVSICEVAAGTCTSTVATFTMTSGAGSERVRVNPDDEDYVVNWHTRDFGLDVAHPYRVSVSVAGLTLGTAEVVLVSSAKELHSVLAPVVGVLQGTTLPIKFRIEQGIAARVMVTPATATIYKGDAQAFAAAVYDLHDQPLSTSVAWSSGNTAVATIDGSGTATGVGVGSTMVTATAQRVSGTATLVVKSKVASIEIDPVTASIPQGQTRSFTAIVKDVDGNTLADEPVTWSIGSSPAGVATLSTTSGYTTVATGVTPGTATITATTADKSATATLAVMSLCSADGLYPFGNATAIRTPYCALRLTPPTYGQAGGAWSKTKVKVANGFQTEFTFRMSGAAGACDAFGQCGADGLAFVIQGVSGTSVGGSGGGLGYAGLQKSVAVEFDTWYNPENHDPSSNHIAVQSAGAAANSVDHVAPWAHGAAKIGGDFNDGVTRTVKIVYVPGSLDVYLGSTLVLHSPIDLNDINGGSILDADGEAWVGFTAGTGAAFAAHDILDWSFSGAP